MGRTAWIIGLSLCAQAFCAVADAGTVVIANRSPTKVSFVLKSGDGREESFAVASLDLLSLPMSDSTSIRFHDGSTTREYQLAKNSAYYFGGNGRTPIELREIGIGAEAASGAATAPAEKPPVVAAKSAEKSADQSAKLLTIPVQILVDDDERASRSAWHARLSRRIQAASDLLEKYCRVRLEIVGYGEWVTDAEITDFNKSLTEFEQKVRPDPARIAIGFASQYELVRGQTHLGGTRGPLSTHILLREWSQHLSEPERLEVLLHELGHVLGAAHSPEGDSVMRPLLGDRQARAKDFRIGFDPVNTLAMSLVAEDLRRRPARSAAELSLDTQSRLREIYTSLEKALPKDPAAAQCRDLLKPVP